MVPRGLQIRSWCTIPCQLRFSKSKKETRTSQHACLVTRSSHYKPTKYIKACKACLMSSTSRLLSICPDCTCSMHTQVPYRLVPFHMHFLLYLLFNLLSIAISLAGTAYTDCLWFSQQGLHVNSSLGPLPVPACTKIETTAIWRFHIPFQLRGLWGASKTLVHCVSLLPQKKRPWVFCAPPDRTPLKRTVMGLSHSCCGLGLSSTMQSSIIMIIIISGTFFSRLKTPLSHIRPYPKMGVGSNA